MVYAVVNTLLLGVLPIAAGTITIVRAGRAPSGRGLAFAGGSFLVVVGLVSAGYEVWYQLVARPVFMGTATAELPVWLFDAYGYGRPALFAVGCALLLFAVLSARGKQPVEQGASANAHAGPQGHGPQPGRPSGPGQGYGPQQGHGDPRQAQQAPGQHQQQGLPHAQQRPGPATGPQPPQRPGGPQQPQQPQQPRPEGHRRPPQPPENGPAGPQLPPQG